MPYIELSVQLNEKLGITSIVIAYNDTGLESNSELIRKVAITMLKSLAMNKDSIQVQELLDELGIERSKQG